MCRSVLESWQEINGVRKVNEWEVTDIKSRVKSVGVQRTCEQKLEDWCTPGWRACLGRWETCSYWRDTVDEWGKVMLGCAWTKRARD